MLYVCEAVNRRLIELLPASMREYLALPSLRYSDLAMLWGGPAFAFAGASLLNLFKIVERRTGMLNLVLRLGFRPRYFRLRHGGWRSGGIGRGGTPKDRSP